MDAKGFGVINRELKNFFQNNGANITKKFVGVLLVDQKQEFLEETSRKKNMVSLDCMFLPCHVRISK